MKSARKLVDRVYWIMANRRNDPQGQAAALIEARDSEHAAALAKAEERCRVLGEFKDAVDNAFHMYDRDMTSLSGAMELIVDARAALEGI